LANTQIAKSCVLRWYDQVSNDPVTRRKLITGIDKIEKEINDRENWYQVRSIGLISEDSLDFRVYEKYYQAYPANNRYVITTVCPNWKSGWRNILSDEKVYSILTWFLHYTMQYMHLSYVSKVLITAARRNHECMHPFGVDEHCHNYGPYMKFLNCNESFDRMKAEWELPSRFEKLSIDKSNTQKWNLFDPFLHEAVFFLHRAYSLYYKDFYQEAFVSLDCAVKSIGSILQRFGLFKGSPSRDEIGKCLKLKKKEVSLLNYTYFIRNHFGAHPGGWRWWHSYEYTEDDQFEKMAELTFSIISKAAKMERGNRLILPDTDDWGVWLFENFEVLWNAVWYEKYDRWASVK